MNLTQILSEGVQILKSYGGEIATGIHECFRNWKDLCAEKEVQGQGHG